MDEREFWRLIDQSREAAGTDVHRQSVALRALLECRSSADLTEFARIADTLEHQAWTWDVWAVGYLLAGGMSDDSFDYFREWLISRGERIYRLALEDPEALADEIPIGAAVGDGEGFSSIAHEVYEERHGRRPRYRLSSDLPVLAGEQWDEDDLEARFPRLWVRMIES